MSPKQVSAAPGDLARISLSSEGLQGNETSGLPSISADGRYVAFASYASNLVAGDTNGSFDIFLHDRQTGETKRVSVTSSGTQGNGSSMDPCLTADGRYILFRSDASNLVSGDTNDRTDVFLHDNQTGETKRVSVTSSGTQGNGNSSYYHLSRDGRFVAFSSTSSNLVTGDTNGKVDIFLHDTQFGTTIRISVDLTGIEGKNHHFSISLRFSG